MTEKEIYKNGVALLEEWEDVNYCEHAFKFKDEWLTDKEVVDLLNQLNDENEELKKELNKLKKFEHGGEHIRLSINIETGELQRHIYATGQWFGDFDRVLVDNWLSKEDYQRFIDRVIEVYNTEFKKELE